MNKTFKVARSLTRGTVVTSEKASSYQGKAVKTVIAAAVALAAGSAFAIDNLSTVTLDNGTKITITTDAEGAYSSTVVGTVKGMNSQKPATEQQFDAGDRLNDDVKVTFKGGELEVVGTDKKVGTVDGAGTLSIISVSGKTDTAAKNATLTVGAAAEPVTLAGQTIVFGVSGTEAKLSLIHI